MMPLPEAVQFETEETDVTDRGRKMDQELRSIAAILRILEDLPEKARRRVIAYLSARFEP